jgi:hypothetical protein
VERSRQGASHTCIASSRSRRVDLWAHRADRIRLHDSPPPSRIFFTRERTHYIDSDSQGKVSNPTKKIERGNGAVSLPDPLGPAMERGGAAAYRRGG